MIMITITMLAFNQAREAAALVLNILFAPHFRLSHFQAMTIFALVAAVAFGFLSRRTAYQRARYIAWSFFLFLAVAITLGWLMYPASR